MTHIFEEQTKNKLHLPNNNISSETEDEWFDAEESAEWLTQYLLDTQFSPDNVSENNSSQWYHEVGRAAKPAINSLLVYNTNSQILNAIYSIPFIGGVFNTAAGLNMIYSGYYTLRDHLRDSGVGHVTDLFTNTGKLFNFVKSVWEKQSAISLAVAGSNLIPWIISTEFSIVVKNALREHFGSAANWLFTMDGAKENNLTYQCMMAGIAIAALLYYQRKVTLSEPVTAIGQHLQKTLSIITESILVTHTLTQSVINIANSPTESPVESTREKVKAEAKSVLTFRSTATDSESNQIKNLNAILERRGQHLSINHLIDFYQNQPVEGEYLTLPDPHRQIGFDVYGDSYREHRLSNLIQIKRKLSAGSLTNFGGEFSGLGVAAEETDTTPVEYESKGKNSLWPWLAGLSALSLTIFIITSLIKKKTTEVTKNDKSEVEIEMQPVKSDMKIEKNDEMSEFIPTSEGVIRESSNRFLKPLQIGSGITSILTLAGMFYSIGDEKQNESIDSEILSKIMDEAKALSSAILSLEESDSADSSYLFWEPLEQNQEEVNTLSLETPYEKDSVSLDSDTIKNQTNTRSKRDTSDIGNTDSGYEDEMRKLENTLKGLFEAQISPKGILNFNLEEEINSVISKIIESDNTSANSISPDTKLSAECQSAELIFSAPSYNPNGRPTYAHNVFRTETTVRDVITGKFEREHDMLCVISWPENISSSLREKIKNRDHFEKAIKKRIEEIYSEDVFIPQEKTLFMGTVIYLLQSHNADSLLSEEKISSLYEDLKNNNISILKLVTMNNNVIPQLLFTPTTSDEKSHVGIYISLLDDSVIEIKNEDSLDNNNTFYDFIIKHFSMRDQTSTTIRDNILPSEKTEFKIGKVENPKWWENDERYLKYKIKIKSKLAFKSSKDPFADIRSSGLTRILDDINYIVYSNKEQAINAYANIGKTITTLAALASALTLGPVASALVGLLSIAINYGIDSQAIDNDDQQADDAKKRSLEKLIFTTILEATLEVPTSGVLKPKNFMWKKYHALNNPPSSKYSMGIKRLTDKLDEIRFLASDLCAVPKSRVKRTPDESTNYCHRLLKYIPPGHTQHILNGHLERKLKKTQRSTSGSYLKKSMKDIILDDAGSFFAKKPRSKYNPDIGHLYSKEKIEIMEELERKFPEKIAKKTFYLEELSSAQITNNLSDQADESIKYIKKLLSAMNKKKITDFNKTIGEFSTSLKTTKTEVTEGFYSLDGSPLIKIKIESNGQIFFKENDRITQMSYVVKDGKSSFKVTSDVPHNKNNIESYENEIIFNGDMILDGKFEAIRDKWVNGKITEEAKPLIITAYPTGKTTNKAKADEPIPSGSKQNPVMPPISRTCIFQ